MTEPMERIKEQAAALYHGPRMHVGTMEDREEQAYIRGAEDYRAMVGPSPTEPTGEKQGGEAAAYLARLQEQVDHLHLFHPEDGPMCRDALPAGALDMLQGAMELDQNYRAEVIREAMATAWDEGKSAAALPSPQNPHRRAEG